MAQHGTAGADKKTNNLKAVFSPSSFRSRSKAPRRTLQMASFQDAARFFLNHLKFLSFPTAAAGAQHNELRQR